MNKALTTLFIYGAILFLLVFTASPLSAAVDPVPWDDYHPELELEYLYPLLYYDGKFYTLMYLSMSSILQDRQLKMIFSSDQDQDQLNLALGYTYHLNKWSCGINLYSMPVYLGQFWESGILERQQGVSLLASYHWKNEVRIDLRLQWEDFVPLFYPQRDEGRIEAGRVFGWEATAGRDNHQFLGQTGIREYLSLGGAYPFLGADYQYLKIEGDHREYRPLGERASLILNARGGKIWGRYPWQRGFMIGGIQLTNFSALGNLANLGTLGGLADTVLRGYSLHQFPSDQFIIGNLELRTLVWPLSFAQVDKVAVMTSAFVDAAQVWKDERSLTEPPISWGIGLKVIILRSLILGLDYASPLNRPGEPEKWHFSIGEVF